jgi:hypothetical protein
MNWVLALLAFSGLMAILSTIVSVAVEAAHKIFDMRAKGLQEMLRALHDSVLVDIDQGRQARAKVVQAGGRSKAAARFANDMVKSPAYGGGGRIWWPSNWKLNLFSRKFESLSLRQFAEQLAQTEFGEKLVKADRSLVRHALARASYEFDRFGVAQSQFFRRRAKAISGLAAFAFVVFANFNAIETYMHLATNEESLRKTLIAVDGDGEDSKLELQLMQTEEQVKKLVAGVDQARNAEEVKAAIADLRATTHKLFADAELPVGSDYFPFCESLTKDDKCKPKPGAQVWKIFGQPVPVFVNQIMARPMEGIVWFMSLVATAGLLGMGAPFWFDIFRTVGALIGPKAISRAKVDANDTDLAKAAAQPVGRGMEKPNLEELTDAFYVAAGVTMMPRSGTGAIGMRLGPSSAEVTGGAPKPPAAARTGAAIDNSSSPGNVSGLPPMRRLPSGWTKKRKKGAS